MIFLRSIAAKKKVSLYARLVGQTEGKHVLKPDLDVDIKVITLCIQECS